MAAIGATSSSSRSAVVSVPNIQNVAVVASTEIAVVMPANTRRFQLKMRDVSSMELRYVPAAPMDNYYTVECGNSYEEVDLSAAQTYTLYITPQKSGVLEVLSWS